MGDLYCCEGCRVLADISVGLPATAPVDAAAERALIQAFGKRASYATRFECHVDPLACEACLQGLARLEQLVPGLRDLQWNRASSVLSFEFAAGGEEPSKAYALLDRMGLSPRWKIDGDATRDLARGRTLRLGITGALAGNLMLFSVPIYAGLAGSMQRAFEIIQLILFLPILLWAAQPIYRTALASFRLRHLSVDLPLAIAFLAGSAISIISVLRGEHDLYFDSLAGFLFLIFWSRSLLEGSLARYLEAPGLERFFERPVFTVTRDGDARSVVWKDIQAGDVLLLHAADRVPVDGVLLDPSAELETAWMTGEKDPHWRLQGSLVQAGSRLLSKTARVRVTAAPHETEFSRLLEKLKTGGEKLRPSFETAIGGSLVIACFVSILGLFFFGSALGLGQVVQRAVALLIVACPCAVSFAAPLARAKANRLAFEKGFWVRDPLVWPRLTSVHRIAFDKTGTLTGGHFALDPHSPLVDTHWKRVILSLENVSRHPIAESLRRIWGPHAPFEVVDAAEIPGGVRGRIDGVDYELRGAADDAGRLRIELHRDGRRVMELLLVDDATAATARELMRLHSRYELSIVSGDRRQRVTDFGLRHGFKASNLHAELTPVEKAATLEKIAPELYFGDGTNDLPAMKTAPVSIAVQAASFETQAASDILMFDAELRDVETLFAIARGTRSLNRRNFALALAYNLGAGAAALAGFVNPLAAAVLMPAASLALLGSTLLGTETLRRLARGGRA